MNWRRLSGQKIELPILDAVEKTLIKETEAGHKLKVCIGTDSQVKGKIIEFATVIVFLREKKGGFMLIHNFKEEREIQVHLPKKYDENEH